MKIFAIYSRFKCKKSAPVALVRDVPKKWRGAGCKRRIAENTVLPRIPRIQICDARLRPISARETTPTPRGDRDDRRPHLGRKAQRRSSVPHRHARRGRTLPPRRHSALRAARPPQSRASNARPQGRNDKSPRTPSSGAFLFATSFREKAAAGRKISSAAAPIRSDSSVA